MNFEALEKELVSLIEDETNLVANLANVSASIYHAYPGLNWCGFYLWSEADGELVLGPFQGRPACIRIRPGKGVCGTSFERKETIRVEDVHAFPGHIACDTASESELVVPLIRNGIVKGVLDLDAPVKNRFSEDDARAFTGLMQRIVPSLWR